MAIPSRLLPSFGALIFALTLPVCLRAQTIHIEAETGALTGPTLAIQPAPATSTTPAPTTPTPYSGTGYVTGFDQPSDHLILHVNIAHPGFYSLAVTYRTPQKKGFDITINDTGLSGTFPPTTADSFASLEAGRVELPAGPTTITFNRGWGHFDIDAIDLIPQPTPTPPPTPAAAPVDPHITPEARALLAQLDAAYGKSTAVGVYADSNADYALATTGRRPVIMGGDLSQYSPFGVARRLQLSQPGPPDEVDRLIADYRAGYTLTLCWHWLSPSGAIDSKEKPWYRAFYTDSTNFDASRAVDPTTPEHAQVLADIDAIAIQLRRFQDARIPILWRPLHESQGGWFWWGAKGPDAFKQLWALLYNRLVNVDGIHNLVWVFTSGDDLNWYPGDAFVDVIGIDSYPSNIHDTESGLWDLLQKRFIGQRPLTIAEFGGVPDIPLMQRYGEWWSYAVSWRDGAHETLGPKKNTPAELIRIYTSPGVTTLPPPTPSISGDTSPPAH
jgi:mannan endo-1,4-beta-mannosidase